MKRSEAPSLPRGQADPNLPILIVLMVLIVLSLAVCGGKKDAPVEEPAAQSSE